MAWRNYNETYLNILKFSLLIKIQKFKSPCIFDYPLMTSPTIYIRPANGSDPVLEQFDRICKQEGYKKGAKARLILRSWLENEHNLSFRINGNPS